jgi:hypothetical protein
LVVAWAVLLLGGCELADLNERRFEGVVEFDEKVGESKASV